MGEIADYLLDCAMMSEDDWDYYGVVTEYRTIKCRYCGRRGFRWTETSEGWRLANPTGRIHSCRRYFVVPDSKL